MNKKFVALTVAGLGTILVSISAQAGLLAFDAAGNLFLSDRHSISKYAPDGTKSPFAAGLNPLSLSFDGKGNLFVVDESSILKFTPDGKRGTFAKGISPDGIAFDRSGNLLFLRVIRFSNSRPKG